MVHPDHSLVPPEPVELQLGCEVPRAEIPPYIVLDEHRIAMRKELLQLPCFVASRNDNHSAACGMQRLHRGNDVIVHDPVWIVMGKEDQARGLFRSLSPDLLFELDAQIICAHLLLELLGSYNGPRLGAHAMILDH